MNRKKMEDRPDPIAVFDEHAEEYDRWFDRHENEFRAEVEAMQPFVPGGTGVEIGAGTGRFSLPLGVPVGVEPAEGMARIARSRGLCVCRAFGERLPFAGERFDFALAVTVFSFIDLLAPVLKEICRILVPGGFLVAGMIDRESPMGKRLQSGKEAHRFFRAARLLSVSELKNDLQKAGFRGFEYRQTLLETPGESGDPFRVLPGTGKGAFVAFRCRKG